MRYAKRKLAYLCMMFAAGLSWQEIAAAAENDVMHSDSSMEVEHEETHLAHDWLPVGRAYLDDMRGGLDTGSGLKVSFGIQRAVYINGDLVASTHFDVMDASGNTNEQARTNSAAQTVYLIQNGPGNHFDPGAISQPAYSAVPIVIQNTLHQQDIRNLTVINATTNSLELFNNLNMQSMLTEVR